MVGSIVAIRARCCAASLALALSLASCGGDTAAPVAPSPSPAPPPPSSPAPASRNVLRCLSQYIPGLGGVSPASLILPDTIKIDMSKPAGFPNGRQLQDQAPDITLAVLLLDMNKHSPDFFARLPLNPAANDVPFLSTFPFVAAPQGSPTLAPGTGTSFNFRTDPVGSYVRVDREGSPAVTTALIGGAKKSAYNDANPSDDVSGVFLSEIVTQLTVLHNGLADDLIGLGLTPCSD